eukprot:scaffold3551_cov408-Prasinococcus_capsulatus_cf.AAC.8
MEEPDADAQFNCASRTKLVRGGGGDRARGEAARRGHDALRAPGPRLVPARGGFKGGRPPPDGGAVRAERSGSRAAEGGGGARATAVGPQNGQGAGRQLRRRPGQERQLLAGAQPQHLPDQVLGQSLPRCLRFRRLFAAGVSLGRPCGGHSLQVVPPALGRTLRLGDDRGQTLRPLASCRCEKTPSAAKLYIMTIGVLPAYRGCGIGSKLLNRTLEACKADPKLEEVGGGGGERTSGRGTEYCAMHRCTCTYKRTTTTPSASTRSTASA